MRLARRMSPLVAMLAVLALSGCVIRPLEIDLTIRRPGTISYRAFEGGHLATVTLSGVVACSGGTTSKSEPLDLFVTVVQNGITFEGRATDHCSGPRVWQHQVDLPSVDRLHPGVVQVAVEACTNPSEFINEDCTVALETVTLTSVTINS